MPSSSTENQRHGGALQIRGLRRCFGPVIALDNVSLEVGSGEFFSVLGPSGCGKTTLLRIIAGLDAPDAGAVLLDGEDLLKWPAHERPVNTVFQSYALFPHLNVEQNIAFGLRMKKRPGDEIASRVRRAAELVHVEKLLARKPNELSGGQRQRVALARALVNEPRVLLLDEPLAAVDQQLRKQVQGELRALQRELGMTFICVTHDQDEALTLSDRMAVMRAGNVEQVGSPRELYDKPNFEVARFLGEGNFLDAEVLGGIAKTPFGEIEIGNKHANGKATIFFRAERVVLGSGNLKGKVVSVQFGGTMDQVVLRNGSAEITAALVRSGASVFRVGDEVAWSVPAEAISLFLAKNP